MVTILIMSAKMVTPDLLKLKVFRKKCYDVKFCVSDFTNNILSRDSNYNVNMVM